MIHRLLIAVAPLVVQHGALGQEGFSSCGSQALEHRLNGCGIHGIFQARVLEWVSTPGPKPGPTSGQGCFPPVLLGTPVHPPRPAKGTGERAVAPLVLTTPHCPHLTRPPGPGIEWDAVSGRPRSGPPTPRVPVAPWGQLGEGVAWGPGSGGAGASGTDPGPERPPSTSHNQVWGDMLMLRAQHMGALPPQIPSVPNPAGVHSRAPPPEGWGLSGTAWSCAPCWPQGPTVPLMPGGCTEAHFKRPQTPASSGPWDPR